MKRKLMLLLVCLFVGIGLVTAQNQKVTGVVISEDDGQPVVGASILVKGTTVGTTSDIDGQFVLNVPASGKTLIVSYIGMVKAEFSVKPNMRIVLKSNAQVTDEVVVVAYGTAKKSSFTGSAGTLKADKIAKQQVSNISKALEGAIAGVQITSTTGQPGSSASISVRGIGSVSAEREPLIVLDGVPYDGSLNSINNSDIESMTILKDAAANSLYGARGGNGVIMITTKKGVAGKLVVSVDAKWGVNSRGVDAYKTIRNQGEYYELYWEALRNSYMNINKKTREEAGVLASNNLYKELGNYNCFNVDNKRIVDPNTGKVASAELLYNDDWQNDPFKNGIRREYNVSLSGGSEKMTMFASMNYLDDSSYLRNSDFKKYTGRVKLDYQPTEWMKTGFNTSYALTETNSPNVGGSNFSSIFYFGQNIAPIYPIYRYDEQGKLLTDVNNSPLFDFGNDGGKSRPYGANSNSYYQLVNNVRSTTRDSFSGKAYLEMKFLKDFKFTVNLSVDNFNIANVNFQTPGGGDALSVKGRSTRDNKRYFALNTNQLLSYDRSIGQHHFDILLAHEIKADEWTFLTANKEGFLALDNPELSNGVVLKGAESYTDKYRLEGYFGKLQYDFKDKYYFTTSYRIDASSNFHPDRRWGSFWSLGASWRINKENFLSKVKGIDNLKFKVSYGTQGNDNLNIIAPYMRHYEVMPEAGQAGALLSYRGNPELTWEKSKNFNIGVEGSFFNRFTANVEYFIKSTEDMLYNRTKSLSNGYPTTFPVNDMAMKNSGLEVELGAKIINSSKVKWGISVNITKYKNELTKLPEGKDPNGYQAGEYWRELGSSLYDWSIYKYAGVDPKNGDALYYKDVVAKDGSVTVTTVNKASSGTRYKLGKSALPTVYGGFSTSLEAYGFDFSTSFSFQAGGYTKDSSYSNLMSAGVAGTNWSPDIRNRWSLENPNTDIPRLQIGYQEANSNSDRFLIKNDCLSLRNITFGYTLPKAILSKYGINLLRFYMVGDNLFLWSSRKGFDPRQNMDGTMQAAAYSPIRTISFGVNLNF